MIAILTTGLTYQSEQPTAVYWVAYVRLFIFGQNGVDAYDCIIKKKPDFLPQTENQAHIVMRHYSTTRRYIFSSADSIVQYHPFMQ